MTEPNKTSIVSAILNAKPAAILGLIVVILIWVMAFSIPKEIRSLRLSIISNNSMLVNICELLARDLPYEQRREYCRNPVIQPADDGYLKFFSGTIGGSDNTP